MKNRDAIVIGAGIIGLSLAIELRKRGMSVLIVEKGEPGREASYAAGGMLADFPPELVPALRELATASAQMYPQFVHELEAESGLKIDLRSVGTLLLSRVETGLRPVTTQACALPGLLAELEPALLAADATAPQFTALYLQERCVDPRHLTSAATASARHRGVDFSSGDQVLAVEVTNGKASGVRTNKQHLAAGLVVNCAGAWAGQIHVEIGVGTGASPVQAKRSEVPVKPGVGLLGWRSSAGFLVPTRPVKGQMLCVAMPEKELVRHVIRTPDVYLIPRSDGRMVIGATQEEAGFDKQTVPETIQRLRQSALDLVPKLADARILETWAGLRPGTPDKLPILGPTATPGYFVATGHFRDGILLAPVTAKLMAQMILGQKPEFDLEAFGAERFES